MRINIHSIRIFLFSMVVILSPFQDTIFGKMPTGILTSNLAFFPYLALLLFSFGELKKIITNVNVFYYLIFFYTVNFLAIIYYQFFYDFEFRLMVYKMFSMSILYGLYFFLIYLTYAYLDKGYLNNRLHMLILAVFVINLSGVLLNFIFPTLFYSNLIHGNIQKDLARPRGFALEPSLLGFDILVAYVFLVVLNGVKRLFWLIPLILLAVLVRSKGGLLIVIFSLIVLQVIEIRKTRILLLNNLVKIFIGLCFFITVVAILFSFLMESFNGDLAQFTSIATRTIAILIGIRSLFFPWGQGFSGFYPFYTHSAISVGALLQSYISSRLNLTEIFSITENLSNVSTKTLLWDGCIIFGIPFFYLYIKYGIQMCRKFITDKNVYCLLLTMLTFISGATFTSFVGYSYLSAICFGYLFYEYKKENISCSS